jgi:hypothetical protein
MILMASKVALSESLAWWTRSSGPSHCKYAASSTTPNWQRHMLWNVNIKPERFLPKAFGRETLRLDRSVQSIQPLSPFDAPHPSKLRSSVLDEPRPSSTIVEAIKRASWGEPVTSRCLHPFPLPRRNSSSSSGGRERPLEGVIHIVLSARGEIRQPNRKHCAKIHCKSDSSQDAHAAFGESRQV